jgi:asparagine synthase (glutamine-hydrolysing)
MANSLEIRCPLLDHRIIELAFRIPTRTKMPNGQPKSLLRGLAERRLPRRVVTMPKRGFTAPTGAWLAGDYAETFRQDVLTGTGRSRDIVDTGRVARLFDEHRRGSADHSFALWAVWMLERWARQEEAACPERDDAGSPAGSTRRARPEGDGAGSPAGSTRRVA